MKKTLIITVDVPETMETDESVVVTISDTDGCMYDFIGVIEGIAKEEDEAGEEEVKQPKKITTIPRKENPDLDFPNG